MKQEVQDRDADLGCIKMYVQYLHNHIVKEGEIPDNVGDRIKKAYEFIQSAYVKLTSG